MHVVNEAALGLSKPRRVERLKPNSLYLIYIADPIRPNHPPHTIPPRRTRRMIMTAAHRADLESPRSCHRDCALLGLLRPPKVERWEPHPLHIVYFANHFRPNHSFHTTPPRRISAILLELLISLSIFGTIERMVCDGDHMQFPPFLVNEEVIKTWKKTFFKKSRIADGLKEKKSRIADGLKEVTST